ncbi:FtsX-like permease family protein [Streptomyces sp. XM4193]|uniref:ABC transporter permease n=1 Tax=Streptomyces sp. XM4193 TaxID=2929782 RepID=UPI001FF8B841|nr:FtsX-like permease family protein [Streptomyces sp. XM4193]MCK1794483.1 FtsX-like permease family protein [Streptomyces sp. XM4193]
MLRTALRNLFAHKARLSMTALAVLLGVAFVAGTLVFGDSVTQAFRNASTKNLDGVAVSVQAEYADTDGYAFADAGEPAETKLTAELVDRVRKLDGVSAVHPVVNGNATLSAKDGSPYNAQYSWQNLAVNWVPNSESGKGGSGSGEAAQDSRYPLAEGRGPAAENEIALDRSTAKGAGYEVGDTVRFATDGPTLAKKLVGVVETDDPRVTAGGTLALFDTATAQKLFLHDGQFHELTVSSPPGTDNEALTAAVAEALPANSGTATSGARLADEQAKQIADSTKALTQTLLVFAGIALFVGIFLIANTFTMLIAQRSREIALLRAVGASRRQVVRSVLIEAGLLGLVASAVGFALGIGIAAALRPLLNSSGAGLPAGPLVISGGTVAWSLVVGVVVTVLAAWLPSRRASRIAPIEALSTVDLAPPVRAMRLRNTLGGVVTGLGVLIMLYLSTLEKVEEPELMVAMAGSALTLTGMIMLAPLLSRPLVNLMGRLTTRFFGIGGKLAQENALRNPRRTAATAAALMIGLTLITGLSVAGNSTEIAIKEEAVKGMTADYKVTMERGMDPELGDRIGDVDGVEHAAQLASASIEASGRFAMMTGADPQKLGEVLDLEFSSGSLADIGPGRIAVSESFAEQTGLAEGDTVTTTVGTGEGTEKLTVVGVYGDSRLVSDAIATMDDVLPNSYDGTLDSVLVKGGGASETDLREALGNSPLLKVRSPEQLTRDEAGSINTMLNMVYGLLAMSLIIAVLGVVNTLAMSVFERTREIGLLRAIGLDRKGVRQMVRLESVVISLFGAVLGIGTGIFLAWCGGGMTESSLATYETVLPWARLALFLLAALATGVLAALWPARRASRLNTLQSLAAD